MSFFKSLMLAILATFFLTYVFGTSFLQLLDINITMDGELLEPVKAISVSALVMVVLIVVALGIVLSVFGGLIFIVAMVLGTIAMVAIGVFWPVILVALAIWLVSSDSPKKRYA
jgi:hypothetical protein